MGVGVWKRQTAERAGHCTVTLGPECDPVAACCMNRIPLGQGPSLVGLSWLRILSPATRLPLQMI